MNIFTISKRTESEELTLSFCKELGLVISLPFPCHGCNMLMHVERGKIRHGVDGRWRCSTRSCRKTLPLYHRSIFNNLHFPISKAVRLMYLSGFNISSKLLSSELSLDRKWVFNFISKMKLVAINFDFSNRFGKLNNADLGIEIDETHIISRRDNLGRILAGERYWVIGGFCRSSGMIRLKVVRNRNRGICELFVSENIELGLRLSVTIGEVITV